MKTVASIHLLNLLDYAHCKGIDRASLQQLLYTPEADWASEQGWVSRDEYGRLWERMMQLSQDVYLGLHFGCFLNLKALGLIYQISLAASSIEQAMQLLEEYLKHTFPVVGLTTGVSRENLVIELHSNLQPDPVRNQVLDSVLFLMYRELGVMIDGEVAEVQVPYSVVEEYQRMCHSPVVASDAHRVMVPLKWVAGPINARRLKNIETLLPLFLQLVGPSHNRPMGFASQVRTMILSLCTPELPVLDQVVAQFAMSHRTFQRKLTDEQTSFREITDEIKRQISAYLERGHTYGTQDIAYILGYSSSSAYLHAAKKWRNQHTL